MGTAHSLGRWIALDIDGTITDRSHRVPQQVIDQLHRLQSEGWSLLFLTGRTFSFAYKVVQAFNFPFYLGVQNGADLLLMPKKELIARHYLDTRVIPLLEEAYQGEAEDFVIYAGYDHGDFCYYRPDRFSKTFLEHLDKIIPLSQEPWKVVPDFYSIGFYRFPLAKCLGNQAAMQRVRAKLEKSSLLNVTMIHDPLGEEIYLNLVTFPQATKGEALKTIQKLSGNKGKVIAAGDDLNDLSMLKEADVKIVMQTAPQEMHPIADILAKPADEWGIIEALELATQRLNFFS